MTWTMTIFTYINLWWIALFFVWPFSVEARPSGQPQPSLEYAAAPQRIYWKKMLVRTSLLSAVFTALLAGIIYFVKQG